MALFIIFLVILTIATQIGGIVLLLAALVVIPIPALRRRRVVATALLFAFLYAIANLAVVPKVAAATGRVSLPCLQTPGPDISALSPLTCLLNRNYVTPDVATALTTMSKVLEDKIPGTKVMYLDAGFPFGMGMPMLPHLSHRNGRNIDLAFFYVDSQGNYQAGKARSPIGYWGFEQPQTGDRQPCTTEEFPTLRWDMTWLQELWPDHALDEKRTRAMLLWLTGPGREFGVTKIFLEPHLVDRLGLDTPTVRFQGCAAARHDDHVHVEFTG